MRVSAGEESRHVQKCENTVQCRSKSKSNKRLPTTFLPCNSSMLLLKQLRVATLGWQMWSVANDSFSLFRWLGSLEFEQYWLAVVLPGAPINGVVV